MKNEYWKKFEETGFVSDYLEYAKGKEQSLVDGEGVALNESGTGDGNGIVGDANRGI
ncbi:MAG: hypothetical protein IIT46_09615 [Lachnospiraceae bacterium]|jgi:hypothetical protein|nr:hypothetical protein [Lachnospiraceae bacterium]MCR4801597.1 hypothetical protein [Lachnospiraceae bacterium]